MLSKYTYLLIGFFCIFLILYISNPTIYSKNYADLWANLLAGTFTALIIDRIVERSAKEKRKTSTTIVKRKLSNVLFYLVTSLAPIMRYLEYGYIELEWKNVIRKEYDPKQWEEYYQRIKKAREESLKDIKYISENQLNFLDDVLQGDVLNILVLLKEWDWEWLYKDFRKDVWKLHKIAEISSYTIIETIKIIEKNNLLEYHSISSSRFLNKDKEYSSKEKKDEWQMKNDLKQLKKYEDESKEFLLAVRAKAMSHEK